MPVSFIEELTEEKLEGITLLYGPAASGKSTACLQAINGKVAYLASRHNFSIERLKAMRADAEDIAEKVALFNLSSITELERAVDQAVMLSRSLKLIIIDSVGTFLREADRKPANLALERILTKLGRSACPVVIVSDAMDRPKRETEMGFVGGDLLRLHACTIIELRDGKATIKKHPQLSGRVWEYKITASGLSKA